MKRHRNILLLTFLPRPPSRPPPSLPNLFHTRLTKTSPASLTRKTFNTHAMSRTIIRCLNTGPFRVMTDPEDGVLIVLRGGEDRGGVFVAEGGF